jgi:phage gp29-like protein
MRRVRIDQWSPGIQRYWTPARVRAALSAHAEGDFCQSAKLVEAMWEDDELPTAQAASINFIVGSEFRLNPASKDKEPIPESEALTDQLEPYWDDAYPSSEIARLLSWFQMLGVAIGALDWSQNDEGKWIPKLRVLNPQFLRWDDSEIDPQTGLHGVFRYQSRDREHIVTPGDGTWVLLSDGRESWLRASVLALAETWMVKGGAVRDLARYMERHGLPIVKAMVPAFANDPDKKGFFNDVRSVGSDTTVLLPTHMGGADMPDAGFDLELLEATDGSWEVFISALERCDRKYQVHFMGTNTNELIDGAGSRATSESGRNISMQKAQELINRVKSDIRAHLVAPFYDVNGIAYSPALLPHPMWLVEGDEDMGKRAETLESFGRAINAIGMGYEIKNIDELAAEYGLTLEKKKDIDPNDNGQGGPGKQGQNEKTENGDSRKNLDNLHDCGLSDSPTPVEEVGKRSGFKSGQEYLDRLTDRLTHESEILEQLDAESMAEIVESAETPAQLERMLSFYVNDGDHETLGRLYEKAIILAQMAGRFGVQEDL